MNDRTKLSRAGAEWAALMTLSPLVVQARLTRLWLSAGDPRGFDRREAERMVTEKAVAAAESVFAASMAASSAMMLASLTAMGGGVAGKAGAEAVLLAALRPYGRRVKANNRRLSRLP